MGTFGGFEPGPGPGAGAPGGPVLPPIFPTAGPSTPGVDASQVATAIGTATLYTSNVASWMRNYVATLFGALFSQLGNIFHALVNFLRTLKETWLGKTLASIWSRLVSIYERVKHFVVQIQKILRRIRQIHDYYYNQIFKPVFDFLQRLRRVLVVFRLFHFKWAQKLDADLAGLESRIARAFLDSRREFNRLINYLNLILDPLGLFNTGIFIKTAARSLADIIDMIRHAEVRDLTAKEQADQEHDAHMLDKPQASETVHYAATIGTPPDFMADVQSVQLELADMGY